MCGFIMFFCVMVLFLYISPCVSFNKYVTIFFQSRARCYPILGTLRPSPCVKVRQAIHACSTSQFPLRGIGDLGVLNSSRMEEKSDFFQAVPNGSGYMDLQEECK
jgi:hypothetical protein